MNEVVIENEMKTVLIERVAVESEYSYQSPFQIEQMDKEVVR